MTMLPTLPIVIPLLAAAACLLAWRAGAWQRGVAVVGVLGLLGSAIVLVIAADRREIVHVARFVHNNVARGRAADRRPPEPANGVPT